MEHTNGGFFNHSSPESLSPNFIRPSMVQQPSVITLTKVNGSEQGAEAGSSPPKKKKTRGKKLFSDEKCAICNRKAQGIKYNAISCDSCRVFFRRIVLLQNNASLSNMTCQREVIINRAPNLTPREIMLKCQHCRLEACLNAGMRAEYVQGTQSFNDRRTCRKVASGRGENDSALVARNKPSTSSTIRSIDASPHDSTMLELVRTFWNDYTSNRHLRSGSVASITAEKNTGAMTRWEQPTNGWSKLRCVDHIRDSLTMHVEVLVDFISVLPYVGNHFNQTERKTLVTRSFMELVILRWTKTTAESAGHITGVTGNNYSIKDMSKFGDDWKQKFKEYFACAMKIKAIGGDDLDHALVAALIVFSSDRNDWLTMEQRHVIHFLQEIFIKALMSKARAEGKGRKFFKLFNSILSLREVVNEADVNQVYRYNRRILPNDNFKGDGGSSGSSPSPNNGDGSSGFNGFDGGSNFRAHRMDSRMLHMR